MFVDGVQARIAELASQAVELCQLQLRESELSAQVGMLNEDVALLRQQVCIQLCPSVFLLKSDLCTVRILPYLVRKTILSTEIRKKPTTYNTILFTVEGYSARTVDLPECSMHVPGPARA